VGIKLEHKRGGKENNRFYLFSLIGKVVFIWCLIIVTAGYVTSNTTAEFNDKVLVSDHGSIGVWEKDSEEPPPEENEEWDKHSLQFVSKQTQKLSGCGPVVIKAKLKNKSDTAMTESLPYDVYYVENGNPKNKHGKKLDLPENEGIIPALKARETIALTFTANEAGSYMFHVGSSGEEEIWSEKIMLKCKANIGPKLNENNKKKQEEIEKNQQQPSENEEVVETQEEETSKNESEDPGTNDSSNESEADKE